jgi:peroxiredoxin-like protein
MVKFKHLRRQQWEGTCVVNTVSYTLQGTWTGGRTSSGQVSVGGLSSTISIPKELGGAGEGTNPEELLLSAASACYMITLGLLLTNRKIPYVRIDLESKAFIENDHGLRFDRIEHYPTIVVDEQGLEDELYKLAEHAEHACMVSSAVRGNVEVSVHPRVLVQTTSS